MSDDELEKGLWAIEEKAAGRFFMLIALFFTALSIGLLVLLGIAIHAVFWG